jgi:hypothetical protein
LNLSGSYQNSIVKDKDKTITSINDKKDISKYREMFDFSSQKFRVSDIYNMSLDSKMTEVNHGVIVCYTEFKE